MEKAKPVFNDADVLGLVLITKRYLAGNCTKNDVLQFCYDNGLVTSKKLQLAIVKQLIEGEPEVPDGAG